MPRPGMSLADLHQMIESRRSELNKLRRQRTDLEKRMNALDRQITRIEGRGGNGRVRNPRSLNDTIEQVLRQAGKPVKVAEIVAGVLRTGYRSNSANFRGIVNQTLIKDKRFGASERGMYQLKK